MSSSLTTIKSLDESYNELENYFRNTIIPQMFVDASLSLRKFSPPAMKQFDLSQDDVGKSISNIQSNFRLPGITDDINTVIRDNKILEKEVQTTDLRWYQMNIIPYIDFHTNQTNGVIITFVDITTRINDTRELEYLISENETLLDTISHDLRTPITSLRLAVELFNNVELNDKNEFQAMVKSVKNSVEKMSGIIEELTKTRKDKYKYRPQEEVIDFEDVISDLRLTLADIIIQYKATLKVTLNAPSIIFSRRKLRSILYNLVVNAIKHSSPDRIPEIFIKTDIIDNGIEISVLDNGKGIPFDKQEMIFSKYFRVSNSGEGTGMGLFLIKDIVSKANGTIKVESTPGVGSIFTVFLKNSSPNHSYFQ